MRNWIQIIEEAHEGMDSKTLYTALYRHIRDQIDPDITRAEVMDSVREVKSNIRSGMLIYRALRWETIDDIEDLTDEQKIEEIAARINWDGLGVYWTWDKSAALVGGTIGGGGFDGEQGHVVITAQVTLKQIDLLTTLYQNVTVFQEEKEVRLFPDIDIKIVGVEPQFTFPRTANTGREGWDDRAAVINDLRMALK